MSFIVAIIIGGVIGWLASLVMKTNVQMGLLANVLVGIVGSVLGHWAAGALGIAAVGSVGSFIIALLGAALLIAILRVVGVPGSARAEPGRASLFAAAADEEWDWAST